jgi:hypothetical protein
VVGEGVASVAVVGVPAPAGLTHRLLVVDGLAQALETAEEVWDFQG